MQKLTDEQNMNQLTLIDEFGKRTDFPYVFVRTTHHDNNEPATWRFVGDNSVLVVYTEVCGRWRKLPHKYESVPTRIEWLKEHSYTGEDGPEMRLESPNEQNLKMPTMILACFEGGDSYLIETVEKVPLTGDDGRALAEWRLRSHLPDEDVTGTKTKYGGLITVNDFQYVGCGKELHNVEKANQVREILRFLCKKKAYSKSTGQPIPAILEHVRRTCKHEAQTPWHPENQFRGRLKLLYKQAVRHDEGLYWLIQ